MAHIECHSHITGRDVKYSLIGVKLKHKVKQEDYGAYLANDNRSYWNTSPYKIYCSYAKNTSVGVIHGTEDKFMYGTSGGMNQSYSASGILESEYENHNTSANPRIASSTYNINEFKSGWNTRELFETDTVKITLEVLKGKAGETYPQAGARGYYPMNPDTEIIYKIYIKYVLKNTDTIIGLYDLTLTPHHLMYPITFSIGTELWCIKDFVPNYKSDYGYSQWDMYLSNNHRYGKTDKNDNGLYVNGIKSQEPGNFVGASFTMLCSECWTDKYTIGETNMGNYKITKDGELITNSELSDLANNAGILFYRNKIKTTPNQFIELTSYGLCKCSTAERMDWCNTHLNTKEYKRMIDDVDSTTDIYSIVNFTSTPILMPCVNPTTFECAELGTEGMFISLTNNILEGPAPDQEPEEEPPEPETVEPAVDPETTYTPPPQEAFEEFPYRDSDTISGLEPGYNAFRPSYSNYIFPKYYRDSIEGDSDWESAITFIQEACNPSSFELWGAAFKLITGHPTPGEIISRVYYLPFEYSEIRGTDSAGFYFSAPVYGPVGPLTLGVKTHSEDPSNTGEPIESNVHYYQQIANRFKTINLGQVTIDRVFNNFLDYSEVNYTLNLPYGAGQVELDPDLLFKNDTSAGDVKLTGVIDFDTGELTIIIQLNGQRYYETTVNVAIDRLASVADNMAAPLAIAKASMIAGAAAGGIARGIPPSGSTPQSGSKPTNNYKSWYSQIPDDDLMEYGLNFIPQKRQNSITQRQNLITQRR